MKWEAGVPRLSRHRAAQISTLETSVTVRTRPGAIRVCTTAIMAKPTIQYHTFRANKPKNRSTRRRGRSLRLEASSNQYCAAINSVTSTACNVRTLSKGSRSCAAAMASDPRTPPNVCMTGSAVPAMGMSYWMGTAIAATTPEGSFALRDNSARSPKTALRRARMFAKPTPFPEVP